MNESDYRRIRLKPRIAKVLSGMATTRDFVEFLGESDEMDFEDDDVVDDANECIQSLKEAKAELSALRTDLQGLVNDHAKRLAEGRQPDGNRAPKKQ